MFKKKGSSCNNKIIFSLRKKIILSFLPALTERDKYLVRKSRCVFVLDLRTLPFFFSYVEPVLLLIRLLEMTKRKVQSLKLRLLCFCEA